MGYVGNQQTQGFSSIPAKQDLTGATGGTLTLTHAVSSPEAIDLYINNVRQEPIESYGAAGTTVTLNGYTVAASDDIYVVYNALALQTSVPPDGSVTSAKLASSVGSIIKNASDPAASTNGTQGDVWLNTTSGELYALTDATTNQNVWTNVGDGAGAVGFSSASGGTETTSGIYTFHTFISSGSFTILGSQKSVDILMVAGGGGGGAGWYAGGGGAGGMQALTSVNLVSGTYTVTVGAGGAGSTNTSLAGSDGGNTSFTGQSDSVGGGGGAPRLSSVNGRDGGSGGGGGQTPSTGGSGTAGQGNDGGNAIGYGAGGGGAGAAGDDGANSSGFGGNGGDGLQWSPNSTYYAGGGGGGSGSSQSAANIAGGQGGGGNGSLGGTEGTAGAANTGGGGGGGSNREHPASGLTGAQAGKAGGSGIVIVRYVT